jgi:hypothetical protein
MVELYRRVVLEQVAPPGRELGVARRHEVPRHEREGVVDAASAEAGDERAARCGEAGERDEAGEQSVAPAGGADSSTRFARPG